MTAALVMGRACRYLPCGMPSPENAGPRIAPTHRYARRGAPTERAEHLIITHKPRRLASHHRGRTNRLAKTRASF